MTPDPRIEAECHDAREHLKRATRALQDAAWLARETRQNELDKSLTAVGATIEGVNLVLISLPRLKG